MADDMKQCIWIINQYASHLEQRHLQLASYFADDGYDVCVITSSFHHGRKSYLFDEKLVFKKLKNGVTYVYLHSGPGYANNGPKRIINMFDFARLVNSNYLKIAKEVGKPNFVIGSSAPPFVWECGYRISKKYDAKFVAEFRDIWPESFVDIRGMSRNHPWIRLLSAIEKRAYRHADAIVSTMPYAYKHVADELGFPREKVHWMPNGINAAEADAAKNADTDIPSALKDYLDRHWCCVYAGSFVASENIDFIIEAISGLANKGIYLAIVGEGEEKEQIEKRILNDGISNVKVFPKVTKAQIAVVLDHAKCCVAASHNYQIYRFGYSANKISDYLCSGTPTVFSCVQEGCQDNNECITTPAEDIGAFRKAICRVKEMSSAEISEMSAKQIEAVHRRYDYRVIAKRYISMLEML